MDLALIRVESERAKESLQLQVARAAAFIVYDEDSFKLAEQYVKEVKAITAHLEEKRDEIVIPAKKIIKAARDDVKPRIDTAERIEQILKTKCLEYRANLARLQAEAEAKAKLLLAQINVPVSEKREALVMVATTTPGKTDGVSFPKHWVATITDPKLVPDGYWIHEISQAKIDLAVASGVREIPGVKIAQRETMSVNFRK